MESLETFLRIHQLGCKLLNIYIVVIFYAIVCLSLCVCACVWVRLDCWVLCAHCVSSMFCDRILSNVEKENQNETSCECVCAKSGLCLISNTLCYNLVFNAISVQKFRSTWAIYCIEACQNVVIYFFELHQFLSLGFIYTESLPTRHLTINMVRCILPICHFSCFLIRVSLCFRWVGPFFTSLNECTLYNSIPLFSFVHLCMNRKSKQYAKRTTYFVRIKFN